MVVLDVRMHCYVSSVSGILEVVCLSRPCQVGRQLTVFLLRRPVITACSLIRVRRHVGC